MQRSTYQFLSLLCMLSFLAMQGLSLEHIADHGVDEHSHHSAPCDVCHHYENTAYGTADDVSMLQDPFTMQRLDPLQNIAVRLIEHRTFSARAPPTLS